MILEHLITDLRDLDESLKNEGYKPNHNLRIAIQTELEILREKQYVELSKTIEFVCLKYVGPEIIVPGKLYLKQGIKYGLEKSEWENNREHYKCFEIIDNTDKQQYFSHFNPVIT